MNKEVKSFIENFIRENAHKDLLGYDLSTGCDISSKAKDELISNLIKLDKENIREIILEYGQKLIDERLPIVETQDRYEQGLIRKVDPVNGELSYKFGGI